MANYEEDYKHLLLERRDKGIAVMTFNRPEKRNAISQEVHDEIEGMFRDIGEDQAISALVITGAGEAFCAGGDATGMSSGSMVPSGAATPFRSVRKLLHSLLEIEQPVIAAVNGAAYGLGANIALYADISIMSDEARIADNHVRMGLVCGDGGVIIWPLLLGWARAREYLLTGDALTGKEAAEIGLVNRSVPRQEVLPVALEWADRLASLPPKALRWTKYSMNRILQQQVGHALDVSTFLEAATMDSDDLREAAAAFHEKREPQFTGQ